MMFLPLRMSCRIPTCEMGGSHFFPQKYRRRKLMQVPSEVKPALWGAVGGAIALAIVGFSWGGWVTGSTANELANKRADSAVVAALTPICVENFLHAADATANLVAL